MHGFLFLVQGIKNHMFEVIRRARNERVSGDGLAQKSIWGFGHHNGVIIFGL